MMYMLCILQAVLLFPGIISSPLIQTETIKDRVKQEDSLLLLLSGFRDYHMDSELTLIQQDCHSSWKNHVV